MPKISVLIPVYNVEAYLSKCIESVIQQTYKNLEIILVDDGSTDKSGLICEKYKKIDNRIKVIHKNNEGLSQARNTALNHSTGSYISFIDSDDFIAPNTYEILINNILYYQADIVWFNYFHYIPHKEPIPHDLFNKLKLYDLDLDKKEFFYDLFNNYHMEAFVWNRLYKRDIFNKIRFPYKRRCEDGFLLIPILSAARKIVTITDYLYYYRQRQDSLSSKQKKNNQVQFDFTESRLLQAIDYSDLNPHSTEANTLLYKAYKKALNYIIQTKDNKYTNCLSVICHKLTFLLKQKRGVFPSKENFLLFILL